VATKIHSYHGGRSQDEEFLVRPRSWEPSHRLEQAARRLPRGKAWYKFLPEQAREEEPEVHFVPIAVGDVVLDSTTSPLARRIHTSYNDAAAVEMEGSGFAHAAALGDQVPAMVIRGISDHADGMKAAADGAGGQRIAARNAAAFAIALAASLEPGPDGAAAASPPPTPTVPTINNTLIARDRATVGKQIGTQFRWGGK